MNNLQSIVAKLASPPFITVAADESPKTMQSRFEKVGISDSLEKRAEWRRIIAGAQLAKFGAGSVILHPEMFDFPDIILSFQKQGVILIVKIDSGLVPFDSSGIEQITTYSSNIAEKLKEWKEKGAEATKFRSVFTITHATPTEECIRANAKIQAFLAKTSQGVGLVPMIEPEVLRKGIHSLARCKEVTEELLLKVFEEVKRAGVDLACSILKPNMITQGEDSKEKVTKEQVAEATLSCLFTGVPKDVAGVNFLSGGLDDKAIVYLNEMSKRASKEEKTNLGASFGRAILSESLKQWAKTPLSIPAVQNVLAEKVALCSRARQGKL